MDSGGELSATLCHPARCKLLRQRRRRLCLQRHCWQTPIHTIADTQAAFASLSGTNVLDCTLVFSHLEISPIISNRGVPIMSREDFSQFTHDQLNNQVELLGNPPSQILRTRFYDIVDSGKVLNYCWRSLLSILVLILTLVSAGRPGRVTESV